MPNAGWQESFQPGALACGVYQEHAKRGGFNPYEDNKGTVATIAGPDFVVFAGDTRLSEGYSIVTRDQTKLRQLTETTMIATSGMFTDEAELWRLLQAKLQIYEFKMGRKAGSKAIAHMLSKVLYGRRFFPYYTFNIVGGLDEQGHGVTYGYDAVGSYGAESPLAQGSGAHLLLPYLDSEIKGYNDPRRAERPPLTIDRALEIMERGFHAITERDPGTGDYLEMVVITKDGARHERRRLRQD